MQNELSVPLKNKQRACVGHREALHSKEKSPECGFEQELEQNLDGRVSGGKEKFRVQE